MDLKGKCAVVTGGANGIGLSFVKELLANGVAKCAIIDIDTTVGEQICKKLCQEFGGERVKFVKADVTKKTDWDEAMKSILTAFKSIDLLVNNAGILNEAQWEKMVAVNINGLINGITAGLQVMGKDNGGAGGTIVNMSSILGMGVLPSSPVYCATKHASIGLTRAWSHPIHYKMKGVRMMVICPGLTDTGLIRGAPEKQPNELMRDLCSRELASVTTTQSADHVAQGLIHMLKNGENGSVWVSEDGEPPYEVCFPPKTEMRKK